MPCSTKQSTRTQSTHRYPIRDSPGPLQKQDRLCKKGWLKILPPKGGHRGLAFLGASSLLEASWPSTVEWQQPKDCRITEQAESLLRKVLATRSYSSFVPFRVALRLFVPTSPQSFCRTIGTIVDVKRSIPVWPSPGPFFRNRRVCGYWGKKKSKKIHVTKHLWYESNQRSKEDAYRLYCRWYLDMTSAFANVGNTGLASFNPYLVLFSCRALLVVNLLDTAKYGGSYYCTDSVVSP